MTAYKILAKGIENPFNQSLMYKPVTLIILDGWGETSPGEHNAIANAATPVWDKLEASYPKALINASEHYVGLPDGQMGNSEVGHMNIGSGRVVMQDLPRIDHAIEQDVLKDNAELKAFIDTLKQSGGTCHLMGLISPGGVHSHQRHVSALAAIVAEEGVPVRVHAFLDGRDTPPQSAVDYMKNLEQSLSSLSDTQVATLSGRYYAMDRDKRWDRVQKAYEAMAEGKGVAAQTSEKAILASYERGKNDEFVEPVVLEGYEGMQDADGVLMANFRADRVREILTALADPAFDGFKRNKTVKFAAVTGMTEYSTDLNQFLTTLFPAQTLTKILGEVVSEAGKKQLRIAETEKYAHVTFFFNGGREQVYEGEDRILIPSPDVPTYDLKPEMSAPEVTDKLVEAIESGGYDLIVANYANTDMVGHTGDQTAAQKAVEAVDHCVGRVVEAVLANGGAALITADHGNAEMMHDNDTGQAHTAHTLNLVPALLVAEGYECARPVQRQGSLADIAPTLLALMEMPQPEEMTGTSLLPEKGV